MALHLDQSTKRKIDNARHCRSVGRRRRCLYWVRKLRDRGYVLSFDAGPVVLPESIIAASESTKRSLISSMERKSSINVPVQLRSELPGE